MWYACPVDLIPFFFTFFFTLRSSSTGLIVGIFCHLIMALGKFIMPVDRPNSHENTIHLEGSIMFPSGDVSWRHTPLDLADVVSPRTNASMKITFISKMIQGTFGEDSTKCCSIATQFRTCPRFFKGAVDRWRCYCWCCWWYIIFNGARSIIKNYYKPYKGFNASLCLDMTTLVSTFKSYHQHYYVTNINRNYFRDESWLCSWIMASQAKP